MKFRCTLLGSIRLTDIQSKAGDVPTKGQTKSKRTNEFNLK